MPKGYRRNKEYLYATKKDLNRLQKEVDENYEMNRELSNKNNDLIKSLVNKLGKKPRTTKKFRR